MDAIAAIRERRAEIARRMDALVAEDRELATTEQVLARLSGAAPTPVSVNDRRERGQPRSQREYVLDALAHSKDAWLRTSDIIQEVRARWGEIIPELSVRPLLTSLKKSRQIVRNGRFIAIAERAREPRPSASALAARDAKTSGPRRRA